MPKFRNFMKLLLSILSFLLLSHYSFSQSQVYKIDYTISLGEELLAAMDQATEEDAAELSNLKAMMQVLEGGKPAIEAWVTKDFYRLKSIYTDDWVLVGDKLNKTLYNINYADSTYVKVENPQGIFALDDSEAELEEFNIEFVPGKTEMVAGFPCKLAILTPLDYDFSQEEMPSIELWYTEKIEPFVWGQFTFLRKLPGAALKLNLGGVNFEATKISLQDVDVQFFQVPAHFNEAEQEAYIGDMEDMELGEDLIAYYDTTSGYYGLKNVHDTILTPAHFASIGEFRSSVSIVVDTLGMFGMINTKGETVLPFSYQLIQYDEEVQAYNYCKDDQFSLMDLSGKQIWKNSFEYLGSFIGDLAIITSNDLNGLVNKKGEVVVAPKYESIFEFNPTHFTAIDGEEYKLYELKTQKLLIEGFKELYLANDENLFIASKDGQTYGYVDAKGQMVIPFIYSMVSGFVDGKAAVVKVGSEDSIYINVKGEEVQEEED